MRNTKHLYQPKKVLTTDFTAVVASHSEERHEHICLPDVCPTLLSLLFSFSGQEYYRPLDDNINTHIFLRTGQPGFSACQHYCTQSASNSPKEAAILTL